MKVALLGYGVVGKGVYDILTKEHPEITIQYILERHIGKVKGVESLFTPSFDVIKEDPSVDVIIELIGGKTDAYTFVTEALHAGKHVITANKALVSAHFDTLHLLAREKGVFLLYEASVAGATIILEPLKRMANTNHFHHIEGIMNGTTNYVLTEVFKENKALHDVLKDAKARGFIEKGSNDDMDGLDAMRKINILSMLAYQTRINEENIIVNPLSSLSQTMITYLKAQGYFLKYIASSTRKDQHIDMFVSAVAYDEKSSYAHVNHEMNMVYLEGKYHENQGFYGQGAGSYPTATAIISDLLLVLRNAASDVSFKQEVKVNVSLKDNTFIVETLDGITEMTTTFEVLQHQEDVVCFVLKGGKL